MNYQNPFINPFGYGQQPAAPFMQPAVPAAQQVVRVNGENGARAFQIGPNGSAMLLDESGTLVWLVTTDGAGYKTVQPYDITPHQILRQLGGGIPPQIRQMIGMIRAAGNPQQMMAQLMQTNPAMRQVMDIVNQYGGDANKAFRAMAEQKGIDPQEIIDMMKGL